MKTSFDSASVSRVSTTSWHESERGASTPWGASPATFDASGCWAPLSAAAVPWSDKRLHTSVATSATSVAAHAVRAGVSPNVENERGGKDTHVASPTARVQVSPAAGQNGFGGKDLASPTARAPVAGRNEFGGKDTRPALASPHLAGHNEFGGQDTRAALATARPPAPGQKDGVLASPTARSHVSPTAGQHGLVGQDARAGVASAAARVEVSPAVETQMPSARLRISTAFEGDTGGENMQAAFLRACNASWRRFYLKAHNGQIPGLTLKRLYELASLISELDPQDSAADAGPTSSVMPTLSTHADAGLTSSAVPTLSTHLDAGPICSAVPNTHLDAGAMPTPSAHLDARAPSLAAGTPSAAIVARHPTAGPRVRDAAVLQASAPSSSAQVSPGPTCRANGANVLLSPRSQASCAASTGLNISGHDGSVLFNPWQSSPGASEGDGVAFDCNYGSLHAVSFEQFMALPENTRAMFSKACPNGTHCHMGSRCVRIHGAAEVHQQQRIDALAVSNPAQASLYGVIACRDYLLLPDRCPRGAKCGYRHIILTRPLTALQACALLMSLFLRVARTRSQDIAWADQYGSGFPKHHAHALIPDPPKHR